jgi:hypothetical protein
MRDHERALMADRRAIIEAARRKLDEVDALLAKRRLQQCTSPRIVRKVLTSREWLNQPAQHR